MGLRSENEALESQEIGQESVSAEQYPNSRPHLDGDVELDAIERLKSNIMMLDDLQQRLRFMNNELESLLGSRKK